MNQIFFWFEAFILIILILFLFFFKIKRPETQFKVREADQTKNALEHNNKKFTPKSLLLTGIKIDGLPHEILGVSRFASREEIQKKYKDLMKIYHPDRIGPENSREWKDAQKIANAIIQAKEKLLNHKI